MRSFCGFLVDGTKAKAKTELEVQSLPSLRERLKLYTYSIWSSVSVYIVGYQIHFPLILMLLDLIRLYWNRGKDNSFPWLLSLYFVKRVP